MPADRNDLRVHVRQEAMNIDHVVAMRGGPDNIEKLRRHASRTQRAFTLDGEPVHGVSVFCALDDSRGSSLNGSLGSRLVTYRLVHTPSVRRILEMGFGLLATFARPHYTLLLDSVDEGQLRQLHAALGAPVENPYHRSGPSGTMR